jgi:hypothetical protein
MRRAPSPLAIGLMLAGAAIAQDLPPEILLLSRVKNHIREELQRLPNISCLETVQREYQPPRGKMRSLDTVRLEVLTDGRKELFASPGDRKFSERHPITYAGSGMLGNGLFGLYLSDIIVTSNVSKKYIGEEEIGGRRLARFDYRLPLMWSGQTIHIVEGSGRVGLHGSYWADPQTYDVLRLDVNADDFPPTLPVVEMVTSINYARTRLTENLVLLLPQSAESSLVKFSGEISHNRMEFSGCRVFEAESAISFDAPDSIEQTPRFGGSSNDDTLRPLPGGLRITVKLRSRISGDMPVGTLIDGVVTGESSKKKGAIRIPNGSPVRGRIRRMELYTKPFPYYIVAVEFTEVEFQGIRHRFYADLLDLDLTPGVERTLPVSERTEETDLLYLGHETRLKKESLTLPYLTGVATFFFRGARLDLPSGWRTVWKTRPPIALSP